MIVENTAAHSLHSSRGGKIYVRVTIAEVIERSDCRREIKECFSGGQRVVAESIYQKRIRSTRVGSYCLDLISIKSESDSAHSLSIRGRYSSAEYVWWSRSRT